MIKTYWNEDSGAVTVDYVVITGALTGLAMAGMAVVSGGVEDLSENIVAALGGIDMGGFAATLGVVLEEFDFSNGRGDWVGGQLVNMRNFGDILALGPGDVASLPLNFPPGTQTGILSFDLIAGDSLDWETAFLLMGGTTIGDVTAGALIDGGEITDGTRGSFNWVSSGPNASDRGTQLRTYESEGIRVTYEPISGNSELGASTNWRDEVGRVTIEIDNPTPNMTFASYTNADQPITDEFFGIDNVVISHR